VLNVVTGHLVNALWVSFSAPLAASALLAMEIPLPARSALPVTQKN